MGTLSPYLSDLGVLLSWALTGDFFKDRLPKADLYILARILHDWTDDKMHALLSKISDACTPGKLCSSPNISRMLFFFFLKNICGVSTPLARIGWLKSHFTVVKYKDTLFILRI